jgi:hypothetical protein
MTVHELDITPEELEQTLYEMIAMHKQGQRHSEEFVKSVRNLQPLEKAEAWLKYVAEHEYNCYSAQEAIVYLVSRGHDCTEIIRDLVTAWKLDERRMIEACMQEVRVWNADTGELGEVAREGISYEEASDILNAPYTLLDFWSCSHSQELSINATMLRTVEWCSIGGFDEWWLRLAKMEYEMAVQGGIDPIPASFYLFNMCRSDYAIELMPKALDRILETIELPDHRQTYPWRRWRWTSPPRPTDHFSYVASIVFANERIRSSHSNDKLASEALLKHQDTKGYWCCWAEDKEPAIDTTAMAVHALATRRPRGWKYAVSAARNWLWSVQDKSGCWIDFGCPDSVYLTVLVLDALELAAGRAKVTFDIAAPTKNTEKEKDTILIEIMRRIDEMHLDLGERLDDLKQGQAAIYHRISSKSQLALNSILKEIRRGRVEQGQLQRTIDSIRRALKNIQDVGLPVDDEELGKSLDEIYRAVNSDLTFQQKLELSIPIIPLLLEYKIELGAEVDFGAVWEELVKLVQQNKAG